MTSLHKASADLHEAPHTRLGIPSGLKVRVPGASDGAVISDLVRATHLLEPVTGYAYVMMADLFGDTCAVAELDGKPAGCVVAFRQPRQPEALFVWQIGVHPRAQRRGVAHAMLDSILARPVCARVTELRATVAPSNNSSEAMFAAFAKRRGSQLELIGGYAADFFPDAHELERLFRIAGLGRESELKAQP